MDAIRQRRRAEARPNVWRKPAADRAGCDRERAVRDAEQGTLPNLLERLLAVLVILWLGVRSAKQPSVFVSLIVAFVVDCGAAC